MAQVTTGIRAILDIPAVYRAFGRVLSSRAAWLRFMHGTIRPNAGDAILDIGCGTADILADLPPDVTYVGIDVNPEYIAAAQDRWGRRGTFRPMSVDDMEPGMFPPFDIALAIGVLHHLDDHQVAALFPMIARVLRPGGRLVSLDPCHTRPQSRFARFVISFDRGRNVRTPDQYAAFAGTAFSRVSATVLRDLLRIPYAHAVLECSTP